MAIDIDELQIQIGADANSASNSLDKLAESIGKLSKTLSGLNSGKLSSFADNLGDFGKTVKAISAIDVSGLDNIAKSMKKITGIDSAKMNSLAQSLPKLSTSLNNISDTSKASQSISDLASSFSKFGYKGVTQATANIPLITANFEKLINASTKSFKFNKKAVNTASQGIVELATAFSRFGYKTSTEAIKNIPQLTKEFKEMLETLSKTPAVSKDLVEFTKALSKLSGQSINFQNSEKAIKTSSASMASAFGKLYAVYYGITNGIDSLWSSIETASDYLETLNYFEEAFGQVADSADLSQWRELGYDSAENYANSFVERASELTSKLTGFNILPEGTLEFTGLTSLGVDPSQVMQYQAVFGQMASSMGVASETALDLSNALTMIGLDLASVRNMDFETVWEDMASGLSGMSRTLDKYGVNIRNVNLQQKLSELGIEANIASLNQNDKALLRTIILLENTQYAYGDLAETLNLPANQLRLLSSNMENLSRILGNLFLPIVQTTLPYINGFVIALQRMFTWVGTMMGIDLSKITESTGENPLDNIVDGSEELEETLDGSLEASEKLKKSLRGFDELETISSETASLVNAPDVSLSVSGGVLDTAFQNTLAEYQKAWDEAFKNVENNAEEFADKIEEYLQPLGGFITNIFSGDAIGAAEDFNEIAENVLNSVEMALGAIDWSIIGQKIYDFIKNIDYFLFFKEAIDIGNILIDGTIDFVGTIIGNATIDITSWVFGIDKKTSEEAKTKIDEWIEDLKIGFREFSPLSLIFRTKEDVEEDRNNVFNWWNENVAPWFTIEKWQELGNSIEKGLKDSWNAFSLWWNQSALYKWYEEDVKPWFAVEKWIELGENIKNGAKNGWENFSTWWENSAISKWYNEKVRPWFSKDKWNLDGIKEGLSLSFENAVKSIKKVWNDFATFLNKKLTWDIPPVKIWGETIFSGATLNLGHIPTFQTGGFPEDGLFYANRTELVGRFSNGKTAVANNEQIIDGIRQAAYEGFKMAMAEQRNASSATNVNVTLEPNTSELFRVIRREENEYYQRTGNLAFLH